MNPINNANHKHPSSTDNTEANPPIAPVISSQLNPAAENELTKTIIATLEHSSEQLDRATAAQLTAARQRALAAAPLKFTTPKLAIAASVLAIIMLPWLIMDGSTDSRPLMMDDDSLSYLSVDPDMLDTMEMLSVLGEGEGDYAQ